MRGFLTLAVSLSALFFTGTAAYPTDPVDLETRGNIAKRSLPKLVHFDNNNPDDRKKNLKIRQAFRDSLQLMDHSVQQLQDNVFKQYFNEGDRSKAQDVFKKALGGDPGRGASELVDFYN
ncbi:uncharacterized protein N7500_007022 [Penicillium coprophilum]|uniref:uncharacterized protein n=1 Tax=Penicillium coprophilum TaxID=36646 RepID=UPI00239145D8|nr:uncharacterized protein N7500_007022 [Penicillium coprophilum]KAJ5165192.1 hypothetical protein N7500_007022 [Penicillium coprophilum]